MDLAEATLLAILYTDGCVSPKKGSWRICVSNTSWEIIFKFKESIIKMFSLDEARVRITQKIVNNLPFYEARVDSKEIGAFLTGKYGTFRTLRFKDARGNISYPQASLPIMKEADEQIVKCFLRVAFSCDGGINLYLARARYTWLIRNVYIACRHPVLIYQYYLLLKKMGIDSKLLLSDGLVRVQGKGSLAAFASKVGFLPGVHITQSSFYWQGESKQKVLELAISSYGNPGSVMKYLLGKDIVRTHGRS